jgi:ElaB/YqjD/DUF883 family membrane-anchored ribosome-binding protein
LTLENKEEGMTARTDDFRRQVNDLWKQAVDQLEEVKEAVVRQTGRFDAELQWLRSERDRLLKRLGEQTHKLASEGKLPIPSFLKGTVDRLDEVIERLVAKQGDGKRKAAKKPARKKAAAKKARAASDVT